MKITITINRLVAIQAAFGAKHQDMLYVEIIFASI